ncbi:MAG: carbonic anhydrase [Planctomycetota bacterium]|nr:MAG: carbonic anhydrase [Planctomycetota bacterium]
MSQHDQLLDRNRQQNLPGTDLPAPPRLKVAILTCMDARVDPAALFGLQAGEAHVIRNAGGVVTDDALRSLILSQRELGTEAVFIMQHSRCGVLGLDDASYAQSLEQESGQRPSFPFGGFQDLEREVRQGMDRLRSCPWLPKRDLIRGFVFHLESGEITEVASNG